MKATVEKHEECDRGEDKTHKLMGKPHERLEKNESEPVYVETYRSLVDPAMLSLLILD